MINKIDLKYNWLRGRLHRFGQNLNALFDILNKQFNNIIELSNGYYLSLYPCKGVFLNKYHEHELGIPDNIFRNIDSGALSQKFTYNFPIPFGNIGYVNDDNSSIRQNDIIVKKYLMADNSIKGYKRIASQYDLSIEVTETQNKISSGCADSSLNCCKFSYCFPIHFGVLVSVPSGVTIYNENTNADKIISTTKIIIYGNPSKLNILKLTKIFEFIKPITCSLSVIGSTSPNIYNPDNFKICNKY